MTRTAHPACGARARRWAVCPRAGQGPPLESMSHAAQCRRNPRVSVLLSALVPVQPHKHLRLPLVSEVMFCPAQCQRAGRKKHTHDRPLSFRLCHESLQPISPVVSEKSVLGNRLFRRRPGLPTSASPTSEWPLLLRVPRPQPGPPRPGLPLICHFPFLLSQYKGPES